MKDVAPDARFATVPKVGHAPTLDEPGAIAAVDAFLSSFVVC
jgi:pimeloyl-ACP methyl ester carboxylesterase